MDAANIVKRGDGYEIVDWPSFFRVLRRRPSMWLGCQSLTALENLVRGIHLAEDLYVVPADRRLGGFAFDEFERWAAELFNPERLSINSFGLVRRSADSEKAAFYRWLEWYDEYHAGAGHN